LLFFAAVLELAALKNVVGKMCLGSLDQTGCMLKNIYTIGLMFDG